MPVLPWLASPAAAAAVRRAPPLSSSPPTLLPLPASSFSPWSWSNRAKGVLPPRGPFATAADTPLGGPLREPDEEGDPLLVAALRAARVRDEESRRPDPLFIDPYAAVLLSIGAPSEDKDSLALHLMPYAEYYRVVTRYIDDKLQHLISNSDDLRQIVLLTDGMDTRPYRLSWPKLSVVYDVSPGRVFSTALQKLRGAGAKISRNCVVLHTLAESPDLQEGLYKNGLNGNRPSLWVLQVFLPVVGKAGNRCLCLVPVLVMRYHAKGLPLFNFKSLEDLLLIISNLAMKGSIFIGELPRFAQWRPAADMASEQDKLENLFFTQGFRVSFVQYDEMVKDVGLGLGSLSEIHGTTLFIAEQLRFSDAQMESFRMHFERIEEDADEDGFEEL